MILLILHILHSCLRLNYEGGHQSFNHKLIDGVSFHLLFSQALVCFSEWEWPNRSLIQNDTWNWCILSYTLLLLVPNTFKNCLRGWCWVSLKRYWVRNWYFFRAYRNQARTAVSCLTSSPVLHSYIGPTCRIKKYVTGWGLPRERQFVKNRIVALRTQTRGIRTNIRYSTKAFERNKIRSSGFAADRDRNRSDRCQRKLRGLDSDFLQKTSTVLARKGYLLTEWQTMNEALPDV